MDHKGCLNCCNLGLLNGYPGATVCCIAGDFSQCSRHASATKGAINSFKEGKPVIFDARKEETKIVVETPFGRLFAEPTAHCPGVALYIELDEDGDICCDNVATIICDEDAEKGTVSLRILSYHRAEDDFKQVFCFDTMKKG